MIVSIRGTHGSGKSTIVKKIIDRYKGVPGNPKPKGRCDSYSCTLPTGRLYVVGSYHNACGGCDGIQPYSLILDHISHGVEFYDHILLEGALVSSSYGSVGHRLNDFAPLSAFAFLDTPLELCLERIRLRRAAKGNLEPLNPHNTTVKFHNVERTKEQMRKLGSNVRIVNIRHTHAVMDTLKLFGVQLRKEPT